MSCPSKLIIAISFNSAVKYSLTGKENDRINNDFQEYS